MDLGGLALSSLSWDPAKWLWPTGRTAGEPVSFFEYSVRIGRHALLWQQHVIPMRMRVWLHAGISHAFLTQFWDHIWSSRISGSIMYFMWMIAHVGIAVGTLSVPFGHDPICERCEGTHDESPCHCLWNWSSAQRVWRAISLFLIRIRTPTGFISWGAVSWLLQFLASHPLFKKEVINPIYMLTNNSFFRGTLGMLPSSTHDYPLHPREPLFATVVSISLWCIWKSRCIHVLSDEQITLHDSDRVDPHFMKPACSTTL